MRLSGARKCAGDLSFGQITSMGRFRQETVLRSKIHSCVSARSCEPHKVRIRGSAQATYPSGTLHIEAGRMVAVSVLKIQRKVRAPQGRIPANGRLG